MKEPTQGQIKKFLEWCLDTRVEKRAGFWDECGHFTEMQGNPYSPHSHPKSGGEKVLCYLVEDRELTEAEKTEYIKDYKSGSAGFIPKRGQWWEAIPDLDLNNLFKYAVPKLERQKFRMMITYNNIKRPNKEYMYRVSFCKFKTKSWGKAYSKDPALALFWAIYQVMEGDK
jgi:hypothetical protein